MAITQSLKQLYDRWPRLITPAVLGLFVVMAIHLVRYTFPAKVFTDEELIYDLIWLDAWGLMFIFTTVLVWNLRLGWRWRGPLLIAVFAVYGAVAVSLMLDGTPFGFNSYWGDQKFHTAMILKFMTWWVPVDFYQKGLPPFYPPVYYFLLSIYARVFSLDAYQMIKIGTQYIYLLGPVIVFFLWRKVVTSYQAFIVTLAAFLCVSAMKPSAFAAPHAFVGNMMFIPWWLVFVEQVRPARRGWKWYLGGGLLGGVIFMTYIYAFFIGGLLLILRLTVLKAWAWFRRVDTWRPGPALLILGLAALFSSPLWGRLLYAMLTIGADKGLDWHHINSVGILFSFVGFSTLGLAFLGGIYYAVRRFHAPLYRGLVLYLGALLLYYLIGATLGAINHPVNLIKANELVNYLAGPFIGLALAALLRLRSRRVRRALGVLAVCLLIVLVHQFNGIAKLSAIATARKAELPNWHLDQVAMKERTGDVFLSAEETLAAFYPVYYFIAINHHYSNPAALFVERYRFLYLLQGVGDCYLFNIALRENRFDRVDFFWPRVTDSSLAFTVALDNYPNKHTVKDLQFPKQLVSDNRLFVPQEIDNLYYVDTPSIPFDTLTIRPTPSPVQDSLRQLARYRLIESYLTPEGCADMDRYLGVDWSDWLDMPPAGGKPFADSISVLGSYAVSRGDSLYLIFALQPHQPYRENFRAFLHLYRASSGGKFENFDFMPDPRVPTWGKDNIVFLIRAIPADSTFERVHFGLFDDDRRIGGGWSGRLNQGDGTD